MKKGRLFVFAAPSGSGKTTIARNILNKFPELVFSISATTRKARNIEKHGKDYFFISEEEFKEKIDKNEFVEWEKFYDYYYGTLRSFVEKEIFNGISVVLDIDVKGAVSIKESYSDAVLIFVSPPSLEELTNRLINRNTETDIDLKKRIERAEMEMSYKNKFDHVILNDDLEKAKKEAEEIIKEYIN
ncbi:MAG: guanylate kinase [Ignavibacteria bacterium GWB2_35_6b]|nr:MAG: guanylate kinase [Ignavibacteria bacterium GWB2_35_6b]